MIQTSRTLALIGMIFLSVKVLPAQGECNKTFQLPSTNNWREHNIQWPGQASAIHAASKLFADNTGKLYYIGADGYVYNYYFDANLKKWDVQRLASQYALIDPRGGIAFTNNGKIFVIGNDKSVYNFYWQNNAWQFNKLPGQYAFIDARGGLIVDPVLDKVFCIGTNGRVYNYYRRNNAWQFDLLTAPYALANPSGGMAYDPVLNKLFVIGNNGKVYNYYFQNNAWVFNLLSTGQYVNANAVGKMIYDRFLDKIFVIGTNGKVCNLYWNGSSWQFGILQPNQYATVNAAGGMAYDGGKVYVIGTDGNVYNYYYQNNSWQFDWLVQSPLAKASPASGMTIRHGKVYVVGTDGKIYNYYRANNKWNFDALIPTQTYPARIWNGLVMNSDMNLFYSDNAGQLQELYYAGSQIDYQKWNLVYSEDFGTITTTPLSTFINDWQLGFPWGHNIPTHIYSGEEVQLNTLEALSTSNFQLHITANNIPTQGRVINWESDDTNLDDNKKNLRWFNYTSGAVMSKTSYTYGLFEVSLRQPAGQGFWPAFWFAATSGWPPEIDVLEGDGRFPNYSTSNNVVTPSQGCFMKYHWNVSPDFTQGFHKFSLVWLPDRLIYYLDDIELRTIHDDIPDQPMHVLINLALRGTGAGVNSSTVFPSSLDVDYIRIYSLKP